MKMERLYSIKELANANWFPHKERTIRKLIQAGKLKVLMTTTEGKGNYYKFKESDVKKYLDSLKYEVTPC